jgi:hypothetical protein
VTAHDGRTEANGLNLGAAWPLPTDVRGVAMAITATAHVRGAVVAGTISRGVDLAARQPALGALLESRSVELCQRFG